MKISSLSTLGSTIFFCLFASSFAWGYIDEKSSYNTNASHKGDAIENLTQPAHYFFLQLFYIASIGPMLKFEVLEYKTNLGLITIKNENFSNKN